MRIGIVATMAALATCLTLPDARAQADCANWNSGDFFETAGAADVRACLRAGADPNARDDEYGATPLGYAAWKGDAAAIAALIEAGTDPNVQNYDDGGTPLHGAAAKGHAAAMAALLEAGADPNVQNYDDGGTPLHFAAYEGNVAMIAMLLRAGADPNAFDDSGETPLDAAIISRKSTRGAVRTLRAAGAVEGY